MGIEHLEPIEGEGQKKEVYLSFPFKNIERARVALRRQLAREQSRTEPREHIINSLKDGLQAIGGSCE